MPARPLNRGGATGAGMDRLWLLYGRSVSQDLDHRVDRGIQYGSSERGVEDSPAPIVVDEVVVPASPGESVIP